MLQGEHLLGLELGAHGIRPIGVPFPHAWTSPTLGIRAPRQGKLVEVSFFSAEPLRASLDFLDFFLQLLRLIFFCKQSMSCFCGRS